MWWRGICREDGRKEQQRVLFSPGLAPTLPFSPRVVLAVFIVPSQSTQVYLERKLEAFSVHHHDWDTSFSRARVDWACTPSMSEFTQTQDFCSLDCNILWAWSESTTGNGPKRRYYVYNWKDLDIWWTAVHCAWNAKHHNWANWANFHIELFLEPLMVMTTSKSNFLPREHTSQSYLAEVTKTGIWFVLTSSTS